MSAKIMGQVWDLQLPFNQAWVLLAMADHADHQGKNVFPSRGLIAYKTGYSLPNVARILKQLKKTGILIEYSQTRGGVKVYRIETEHIPRKPPFVEVEAGRPEGSYDKTPRKNPYQIDTPFCDTHNHQFPINNRDREGLGVSRGISNCSAYRETPYEFPDSDTFDPFGDDDS
ncbi:hypothetical protein IAD21_00595 [Abditibacteriota bacterium]|nr:hypothetical protein IAD21_00595 [Abditibacteriota bacterium]